MVVVVSQQRPHSLLLHRPCPKLRQVFRQFPLIVLFSLVLGTEVQGEIASPSQVKGRSVFARPLGHVADLHPGESLP